MKSSLAKVFSAFGHCSTRLFIIDLITKSSNSISYEQLIKKVTVERKVKRDAVRWHVRKMLARQELVKNGNLLHLKQPMKIIQNEAPWEAWSIIAVPTSVILLVISLLEGHAGFRIAASTFLIFTVAIHVRDIQQYLRKLHARE